MINVEFLQQQKLTQFMINSLTGNLQNYKLLIKYHSEKETVFGLQLITK